MRPLIAVDDVVISLNGAGDGVYEIVDLAPIAVDRVRGADDEKGAGPVEVTEYRPAAIHQRHAER